MLTGQLVNLADDTRATSPARSSAWSAAPANP
jgi:hypothetical protein